jgi:mono/diheme cytochrome c family protein
LWAIGIVVLLFLLIQLVPYGRSSHSNPPATNPFAWTDPAAEAIARESCYDCHSNETEWWWATSIAPFSWLTQRDVDEGRANLNFSEFAGKPSTDDVRSVVKEGEMPPFQYTLIHPGAKLTGAEKKTLIAGYAAGFAATSSSGGAEPAPEPSATPTASATAVADAEAIIGRRCGSCHPTDRALGFRAANEEEAQALLDAMIGRGAQVSAEEQQVLLRYFTQ